MKLIIDASTALKWLIPEECSDKAILILRRFQAGAVELHAPTLLRYEVYNGLRTYLKRGLLGEEYVGELTRLFSKIELRYHEADWNELDKSLKYAIKYDITVYDAIYIALAEKLRARFITADKNLCRRLARTALQELVTYLLEAEL